MFKRIADAINKHRNPDGLTPEDQVGAKIYGDNLARWLAHYDLVRTEQANQFPPNQYMPPAILWTEADLERLEGAQLAALDAQGELFRKQWEYFMSQEYVDRVSDYIIKQTHADIVPPWEEDDVKFNVEEEVELVFEEEMDAKLAAEKGKHSAQEEEVKKPDTEAPKYQGKHSTPYRGMHSS